MTTLPGHARFAHPPLTVEVDGPYACFTRPERTTERVSYPVMTPSAARGVLQAIYREPGFDYVITAIEVLAEIRAQVAGPRPSSSIAMRRGTTSSHSSVWRLLSRRFWPRARQFASATVDVDCRP